MLGSSGFGDHSIGASNADHANDGARYDNGRSGGNEFTVLLEAAEFVDTVLVYDENEV